MKKSTPTLRDEMSDILYGYGYRWADLTKEYQDNITAILDLIIASMPKEVDDVDALWSNQVGHPLTYNQALKDVREVLEDERKGIVK